MTETLTILKAKDKKQAKVIKGNYEVKTIADEKYFTVTEVEIENILKLSHKLKELEKKPNLSVVRDKWLGKQKAKEFDKKEYLKGYTRRTGLLFEDKKSHILMVDVDNFLASFSINYNSVKSIVKAIEEFILNNLPNSFHYITYHWHLSSRAALSNDKRKLKVHLWFWLKTPYKSRDLKIWSKDLNIDSSLYDRVHIHYIANPICDGVEDPIKYRSGLEIGIDDQVNLIIPKSILDHKISSKKQEYTNDFTCSETKDKIVKMLSIIPSSIAYPSWFEIACGIKNELGDTNESFDTLHNWSECGEEKYKGLEDVKRTWDSIDLNYQGEKIGIGTIRKFAYEYGYREDISDLLFDDSEVDNKENIHEKFQLIQANEFSKNFSSNWSIKNLLPKTGLAVVYGASGSGKTFLVLDLCIHLSMGEDWRGLKIREVGKVCYVAAEGVEGIKKRLVANSIDANINLESLDFYILSDSPNLNRDKEDVALIASLKKQGGVDLIVIDTLAQATPGANENAGEDMGRILERCQNLIKNLNCLVLLVHHSGKDQRKGARGWSGLKAAADTEIFVSEKNKEICAEVTKQKDGEAGKKYPFSLKSIDIGKDEDGDSITSCVVMHEKKIFDNFDESQKTGSLEKIILKVMNKISSRDQLISENEIVLEVNKLQDLVNIKESRKSSIKRSLDSLVEKVTIIKSDENYKLAHFT